MDKEATENELQAAYADLERAENTIIALKKEINISYKIKRLLIAAEIVSVEKFDEAETLLIN